MDTMSVGIILPTRELCSEPCFVTSPSWSMLVFPSHGECPLSIKMLSTVVMDVRDEVTLYLHVAHQSMAASKELRVWVSVAITHPVLVQTQPQLAVEKKDIFPHCSSESKPLEGFMAPLIPVHPQTEEFIWSTVLLGKRGGKAQTSVWMERCRVKQSKPCCFPADLQQQK